MTVRHWDGATHDALLRRLLDEGRSLQQAAAVMGFSVRTVSKQANRLGLGRGQDWRAAQRGAGEAGRLRELVEGGATISGAARIMGWPIGSIIKLAKQHGITSSEGARREALRNRRLAGAVVRSAKPAAVTTPEPAPAAAPIQFKPWTPGVDDDGCNYVLQTRPVAYCGAPRRDRRCSYCTEHATKLLRAYDPMPRREEARA